MNLEKLKDSARKFEQKEDWRKAIEVYLKAIQQIESGAETSPDLSLYNRVGDLYLKINDTASAVRSYERAVDLYADQGFFNNAIALCGKILRVNPGRTQTYLKLAQLHARKNVVIEAKRNLIEFLERMNALGQLDQAFQSVKEFADQFSGSQEIRMMLVELLRAASREEEALEQLAKIAGDLESRGQPAADGPSGETETRGSAGVADRPVMQRGRGDLVFLDTGFDAPTSPAAATASAPPPAEVTRAADLPMLVEAAPAEGLEPTQPAYDTTIADAELIIDPLATIETDAAAEAQPEPLAGLEQTLDGEVDLMDVGSVPGLELDAAPTDVEFDGVPLDAMDRADVEDVDATAPDGLIDVGDDLDLQLAASEPAPAVSIDADLDLEFVESEEVVSRGEPTSGLPLIGDPAAHGEPAEVAALEDRIADDPGNPDLHRELADHLLLDGDLARAAEELRLSLEAYESAEDWSGASGVADRLVALEPDAIHHHQKRVELAFRTGERSPLLEAYLALGDALRRAGAHDKAMAVYGRVHEHDPDNARAARAMAELSSERAGAGTSATPSGATAAPAARSAPPAAPPPPVASPPVASPPVAGSPPAGATPPAPAPPPPRPSAPDSSFVDLGSMIFEE
ncbi:MAG TPA: tetratricopeptide repeat protein, partial [Gemmatimonadales bacterium]|nr:tetratricopeptide repeat protein [Gemmatimonadales bacterium]